MLRFDTSEFPSTRLLTLRSDSRYGKTEVKQRLRVSYTVQESRRTHVGSEARDFENLDELKLTNTDGVRVSAAIVNEMEII